MPIELIVALITATAAFAGVVTAAIITTNRPATSDGPPPRHISPWYPIGIGLGVIALLVAVGVGFDDPDDDTGAVGSPATTAGGGGTTGAPGGETTTTATPLPPSSTTTSPPVETTGPSWTPLYEARSVSVPDVSCRDVARGIDVDAGEVVGGDADGVDLTWTTCVQAALTFSDYGGMPTPVVVAVADDPAPAPEDCLTLLARSPIDPTVRDPQVGTTYCLSSDRGALATLRIDDLAPVPSDVTMTLVATITAWESG